MLNKQKIIIDSDPGVDDFFAITLAIKSKLFDILGITTVAGNCSLENATRNALKTVELSGTNIPVYAGSDKSLQEKTEDSSYVHGSNGLGGIDYQLPKNKPKNKNAIDFLIEQVNKYPNEITIVAVGPLTNIAKCILKDPSFSSKIKELIIMGGSRYTGNILSNSEFNFYSDAQAVDIVLKSECKKIQIIDLDITSQIIVNPDLEKFLVNHSDDSFAKFIYDITRIGANYDRTNYGINGFIIHDAVTICKLIKKESILMTPVNVKVSLNEKDLGHIDVENVKESNIYLSSIVNINMVLGIIFNTIFPEYKDELDIIFSK